MKKTFNITALALFQIFLIISMAPMFAERISALNFSKIGKFYEDNYLINETYSIENEFSASESLTGVEWGCCPLTKEGAVCENIPKDRDDFCEKEIVQSKCEETFDCKKGCCIDEDEGLCSPKVHEVLCTEAGGEFEEDAPNCEITECQKGCCVLGNNVEYLTDRRCEVKSEQEGYEKDFRQGLTQVECLELQENQPEGACIFEDDECRFLTEVECLRRDGEFNEGVLCSKLKEDYERQTSIGCVEGRDEIYWFDSEGNRENIYSSDKEESWNNGKVLEKSESCNPGSGNIDSETCGNCNYALSSLCSETEPGEGVEDGDYVCEDLGCTDPETGERYNHGESWCLYDGYIGEGKDTPGSRHWLASCINGEIEVEGCSDHRNEICVQSEISLEEAEEENIDIVSGEEDKENFSVGGCVLNEALRCTGLNNTECAETETCTLKRVDVDDKFEFDICTGKYPKGFPLEGASNTDTNERDKAAKSICDLMSMNCTVVYQKDWKGSWDCEENCDCEKKEFSEKMNNACMALGDCGTHVNYKGEGTDNIRVKGAPKISWEDYEHYSEVVEGRYAKPESLEEAFKKIGIDVSEFEDKEEELQKAMKTLSSVSGAAGTISIAGRAAVAGANKIGIGMVGAPPSGGMAQTGTSSAISGSLSALGSATTGAMIGAWAGGKLAEHYNLYGRGGLAMVVGGAIAGAGAAMMMMSGYLATLGPYGVVIGVVLMAWTAITGWGKVKEKIVEFECQTWNPPAGGDDCDKCDEDPLRPCSKYRCQSLGLACEFLNEGTENTTCEAIEDDGTPPEITPGKISEGYQFTEEGEDSVKIRSENGKCIKEFETVVFSLKTDEPAECRYAEERGLDFEDMEGYFVEENSYVENHTSIIELPSIDSLKVNRQEIKKDIEKIDAEWVEEEIQKGNIPETIDGQEVDTEQYAESLKQDLEEVKDKYDELIDKYADMDIYVKCRDFYEHTNEKEYAVNFCVKEGSDETAAGIIGFNPPDNSYLEYGTEKQQFEVMLSEPADCKWSNSSGKEYSQMENTMECKTGLLNRGKTGWKCKSEISNIQEGDNELYIKCKDQPWLSEDDDSRNINNEDILYTLKTSSSELKITSIEPQGEIEKEAEPFSFEMRVETAGGAENGKSECYYSFESNNDETRFYDSDSDTHKNTIGPLIEGDYDIEIRCEDDAGNIAKNMTEIKLKVDDEPPEIVRTYKSGGELVVMTDEKAECYYDNQNCLFEIEEGEKMTTALSKTHSTDWEKNKKYYIKCEDGWGNRNNDCAAIVEAE